MVGFIESYRGGNDVEVCIYDDLEVCRDFDGIDQILEKHGHDTLQKKYDYLIRRMRIVSAQFTGIEDNDLETMYCLARENYLLDYWREQDVA